MSGGSYDYAYGRIEDLADAIVTTTLLRRAFKKHLHKVAQACHDIEWVDSCDNSPGDEDEAIRKCLGEGWLDACLVEAIATASEAHAELGKALEDARKHAGHDETEAEPEETTPTKMAELGTASKRAMDAIDRADADLSIVIDAFLVALACSAWVLAIYYTLDALGVK